MTGCLQAAGLLDPLERLGFHVTAYGCGTCIGDSGPLDPALEADIAARGTVAVAVLSGSRNFEARIHPAIRANFLASPPLVVAFANAGRIGLDLDREPLGIGAGGMPVFLRDVWPDPAEVAALAASAPAAGGSGSEGPAAGSWARASEGADPVYDRPPSTYVKEAPSLGADTATEVDHLREGGVMPFVLSRTLAA